MKWKLAKTEYWRTLIFVGKAKVKNVKKTQRTNTETGEKSAEAYGGESLINKLPVPPNVTEK